MSIGWREVLNALVDLLKDVDGIGPVFDYQPDLREPDSFKKLATAWDAETNLPIINVWFVERTGAADIRGGTTANVPLTQAVRNDVYRITGLLGYAKGGKTTFDFQELVERVLDTLLENITLGKTDLVAKAARLRSAGLREFGDYLSHAAEIELEVERRLRVTFK
jgi:hypothetical protein